MLPNAPCPCEAGVATALLRRLVLTDTPPFSWTHIKTSLCPQVITFGEKIGIHAYHPLHKHPETTDFNHRYYLQTLLDCLHYHFMTQTRKSTIPKSSHVCLSTVYLICSVFRLLLKPNVYQ